MSRCILLIIHLTFLFLCKGVEAQPPAPGSYVYNHFLNKFEGNWMWVDGTDTLVLRMKKYNTLISDYHEDVLLGVHKYVKNGVVLDNSLDKFDSIAIKHKKSSIFLYQLTGSDTSDISGSITDLTKKKRNNLTLKYTPGSPPAIIWHLETAEGVFIDPNFQYGLTMPKDIILTKQ